MKKTIVFVIIALLSLSVVLAAYGPAAAPSGGSSGGDSGSPAGSSPGSGGGSSGGGGGGGSAAVGVTYLVSEERLTTGVTKNVAAEDSFQITLGEDKYEVSVISVTDSKITMTDPSGTEHVFTAATLGKMEITGDDYYDLVVKYDGLDAETGKGGVTLRKIHEKIPQQTTPADEVVEEPLAEEQPVEIETTEEVEQGNEITGAAVAEESSSGSAGLIVLLLAIFLVGVIATVLVHLHHVRKK